MKVEENLEVTNPMPRVPPVTKAVVPLRDHLFPLLLISASPMFIFANFQISEKMA